MNVARVSFKSPTAGKEFADSIKHTGFAVLTDHSIDQQLISDIYEEWRTFFNSAYKNDYLFNVEKHDGYFPFGAENAKGYAAKNLMEYYHVFKDGRYPSQVSDKALRLQQSLLNMAETILGWLQAELPADIQEQLPETLPSMIQNSARNVMRIINYPPLTGKEEIKALRAAPHTDINLITLLTAGTSPGLQTMDKQRQWHEVPCEMGNIAVNAGDMLEMCTQGYCASTVHQVRNPVNLMKNNVPRMSMPLFVHPRDEVQLSAEHSAKSYFLERMRENGIL